MSFSLHDSHANRVRLVLPDEISALELVKVFVIEDNRKFHESKVGMGQFPFSLFSIMQLN
jgi:hypothetical protein